jgi:hypothetical protein
MRVNDLCQSNIQASIAGRSFTPGRESDSSNEDVQRSTQGAGTMPSFQTRRRFIRFRKFIEEICQFRTSGMRKKLSNL